MSYHVYRCYDLTERLIYVGATSNLFGRLASHRSRSWWAPQVEKVKATTYPDRSSALAAERAAISDENPRWNTKGRWSHLRTVEDFLDYRRAYVALGNSETTIYGRRHLATIDRRLRAACMEVAA